MMLIERIFLKTVTKSLSLIGLFVAPLTPQTALAQDKELELDKVVISADFRPKTAQTTATSLTEIDQETIEARGAQHLEEVLNLAPKCEPHEWCIAWAVYSNSRVWAYAVNITTL